MIFKDHFPVTGIIATVGDLTSGLVFIFANGSTMLTYSQGLELRLAIRPFRT